MSGFFERAGAEVCSDNEARSVRCRTDDRVSVFQTVAAGGDQARDVAGRRFFAGYQVIRAVFAPANPASNLRRLALSALSAVCSRSRSNAQPRTTPWT